VFEPLLSYLDNELAFNSVEPLVLIVMQVSRGAALLVERVFQNEEAATVLRGHLESMELMPSPRCSPNRSSPAATRSVGEMLIAGVCNVSFIKVPLFDRYRFDRSCLTAEVSGRKQRWLLTEANDALKPMIGISLSAPRNAHRYSLRPFHHGEMILCDS